MSSGPVPATPAGDLAAWERQRPVEGAAPLLTPDLVALAQSGVNVSLGTLGPEGRPLSGLAVGCRVRPGGTLRILLSRVANAAFLAALREGRPVAATFTAAPDHRAFQAKAESATIHPVGSDDLPEMDRQCALLRDGLVEIGFSPELAQGFAGFDPDSLIAIELVPARVFTQTPGPGAGAELAR